MNYTEKYAGKHTSLHFQPYGVLVTKWDKVWKQHYDIIWKKKTRTSEEVQSTKDYKAIYRAVCFVHNGDGEGFAESKARLEAFSEKYPGVIAEALSDLEAAHELRQKQKAHFGVLQQ